MFCYTFFKYKISIIIDKILMTNNIIYTPKGFFSLKNNIKNTLDEISPNVYANYVYFDTSIPLSPNNPKGTNYEFIVIKLTTNLVYGNDIKNIILI